jgi:hypothetical protein
MLSEEIRLHLNAIATDAVAPSVRLLVTVTAPALLSHVARSTEVNEGSGIDLYCGLMRSI